MDNNFSDTQDRELNALGISKQLRRNLVIGFIVVQFIVIIVLCKFVYSMYNDMIKVKNDQLKSNSELYREIIQHIDKSFYPMDTTIRSINSNLKDVNKK